MENLDEAPLLSANSGIKVKKNAGPLLTLHFCY
jgi:hypothetical protein